MFDEIVGKKKVYIYTLSFLLLFHHYFKNQFHEFKILKKVGTTETLNVDFHYKFVKFGIVLFVYEARYIFAHFQTNQCVFSNHWISAWLLLTVAPETFHFLERFHSMDCLFDSGSWRQFYVQCNFEHFLTKTCLFMNITHSSVNFIWFALFSHQNFDKRPLFKSRASAVLFAVILNSLNFFFLRD